MVPKGPVLVPMGPYWIPEGSYFCLGKPGFSPRDLMVVDYGIFVFLFVGFSFASPHIGSIWHFLVCSLSYKFSNRRSADVLQKKYENKKSGILSKNKFV